MTITADPLVHCAVDRRHDFVILFDVQDGNPNGDPDAGNMPRVDPETMQGIVTDVALKRKVRDYVDAAAPDDARCKIYVQRETYLTEVRKRVWAENADGRQGIQPAEGQKWMCRQFYDIRMFGAVMSMRGFNAGQVRGPVQMTFARSIDPIVPLDSGITRVAPENNREARPAETDELAAPIHGAMGRKATIPYGLYRAYGFFNPPFRPAHRGRRRRPQPALESPGQYVGLGPLRRPGLDRLPRLVCLFPRKPLGQRSGPPAF